MLNYIWAGLIVLSLAFALTSDVDDVRQDTYRNGDSLPVTLMLSGDADDASRPVTVAIDPAAFADFYRLPEPPAARVYKATLVTSPRGREIRFEPGETFPAPLSQIQETTGGRDKTLRAMVTSIDDSAGTVRATLRFPPMRFPKLQAITAAGLDMARFAVLEIAFPLIGVLALWLGLARIAEKAGLIELVVKVTQPVLRPLFPDVPAGHPALGMITLNLTANFLGLGNAATPLGLKAMEQLQELNRKKDTATNSMVMFLAMNTAGVQLVPPAMLVAVMGLRAVDLIVPIWIVTALSLVVAIITAKLLGMLPGYRRSDPNLAPPDEGDTTASPDASPAA